MSRVHVTVHDPALNGLSRLTEDELRILIATRQENTREPRWRRFYIRRRVRLARLGAQRIA